MCPNVGLGRFPHLVNVGLGRIPHLVNVGLGRIPHLVNVKIRKDSTPCKCGGWAAQRAADAEKVLVRVGIVFERDSDSPFKHFQTFSANMSCGRTFDI